MHADTDNEENIFWQKLSYGILERHRRNVVELKWIDLQPPEGFVAAI